MLVKFEKIIQLRFGMELELECCVYVCDYCMLVIFSIPLVNA